MRLPDFIGVGPAHAGTTWLYWVLKSRVGFPAGKKETHFFDYHYERGIEWYEAQFRNCEPAQLVGEICPYFPSPLAPTRIAHHMPECRIVCTLRDPIARIYSAYKFAFYNGLTRDSFEQAVASGSGIRAGTRYAFHLGLWMQHFRREHVLVSFFEELCAEPQNFVERVSAFIGIEPPVIAHLTIPARAFNSHDFLPRNPWLARRGRRLIFWLKNRKLHWAIPALGFVGFWKLFFKGEFPRMAPETEARLREDLRPEIESLEAFIGRDLTCWKFPATTRNPGSALPRFDAMPLAKLMNHQDSYD